MEGMDKDSETCAALKALAQSLPLPTRIVVVSAHWEEDMFKVTSSPENTVEVDYFGFGPAVNSLTYNAPGDVKFAKQLSKLLNHEGFPAKLTQRKALDSGAFLPLLLMYPDANIPVLQLSLNSHMDPGVHYRMGMVLASLRTRGMLVVCSGQATHNSRELGEYGLTDHPPRHCHEFMEWLTETMTMDSHEERMSRLINYKLTAPHIARIHPRPDHFLPLIVAAGAGRHIEDGTAASYGRVSHARMLHTAWVRESMCLASYIFETKDESFGGIFGARPDTASVTATSIWA